MADPRALRLILTICFFGVAILGVHANEEISIGQLVLNRPVCNGSMADCLIGDELDDLEFGLDSETSRRMLATQSKFISYGALNKNKVPCSRRGASYYNCKPGAQANPYKRGCSNISHCRRA